MTDQLADQVAIVTGAARGVGAACVRALHAAGAYVVAADLLVAEGEALAAELGPNVRFERLDVTDDADWVRVVAATRAAFGRIDVLVNNAGIANAGPIEHYSRAKWDAVIAVNLTGVFLGCQAVVPSMKAAGRGSIINMSSVEGLTGSARLHGYVASKFGVRGLTKSLAVELGPSGLRVNSVHPGFVDTDMTTRIDPTALPIPLGRGAVPADVADVVVFLAGDGSRYTTGSEIVVDGGMTAAIGHR